MFERWNQIRITCLAANSTGVVNLTSVAPISFLRVCDASLLQKETLLEVGLGKCSLILSPIRWLRPNWLGHWLHRIDNSGGSREGDVTARIPLLARERSACNITHTNLCGVRCCFKLCRVAGLLPYQTRVVTNHGALVACRTVHRVCNSLFFQKRVASSEVGVGKLGPVLTNVGRRPCGGRGRGLQVALSSIVGGRRSGS
mmetsp:Transcript_34004/g.50474  ORF Transcript_34004/g.50474 Transcript_34004/m.50474 type:complete len:200 (+) Transcript_34004:271-870(+)